MRRETLPIESLSAWMQLNRVELNGVWICSLPNDRGSGIVATQKLSERDAILMTIPSDLVLSLENVWIYAKADRDLSTVLEAVGDYTRTARGAILIFLLLQLTHNATGGNIGVANPFSQYVKYLPAHFSLPTFWSEDETALLEGTSLEAALATKLKSLKAEFDHLRAKTANFAWCQEHWWHAENGQLTFEDWKYVDAAYRSRALDLPGTGHATIPCIDMANHTSESATTALYETNVENQAIMVLRNGKHVNVEEEITITYGDEKGACEMLFSYGFIEEGTTSAKEFFLDLDVHADDPLGIAKQAVARSPPGFRIFKIGDTVGWEGPFVWLLCVNEEDGLEFNLVQSNTGEREVHVSWQGQAIDNVSSLEETLRSDKLWDVFQLRAIIVVQQRLEQQLVRLKGSERHVEELQTTGDLHFDRESDAMELRDLEETLMLEAYEFLEDGKSALLASPVVQSYLGDAQAGRSLSPEDFS